MADLWCISFTIFVLFIPMAMLPNRLARIIYLVCVLALIALFICIKFFRSASVEENYADDFQLQELYERREEAQSINTRNAWSMREHYIPNSQVNMSLGTSAEIARWAIRALPPVKSFDGDETMNCPICMEEFKKGELIQSFGVCAHEFHTSCLNSWLLGRKSTCPVCRKDLFV